ncbi:MAG: hypothetical protein M1833_006562 [Piccolia ochrophora]|nr:MAG: hypothetical protein M1833_006562 [Piccolia ochrophora]
MATQRPERRRSRRLAFDAEDATPKAVDSALPNAKRVKRDDGRTANGRNGPAGVNGAGARKKAALYDEDDDGFTFTRTKSKRTKAAPPPEAPQESTVAQKEAPARRRKKSFSTPGAAEDGTRPRRTSARLSGGTAKEQPVRPPRRRLIDETARTAEADDNERDEPSSHGTTNTKIALPFADTPVNKRNKELRRHGSLGQRRSSIGMRGRRASSLMDSGSSAVPHNEVDATEFYKHISADLPEPRRMKQLLTWCGERALGQKSSHPASDGNAKSAARVIQEEILKDFTNRSEMSDWFSRDDDPPPVIVKKPNPRNVANAAKIQELEQQVQRLQSERRRWESLAPTPPIHIPPPTTSPPSPIDPTHLADPDQAALLTSLTSLAPLTTPTQTSLTSVASSLEFSIDRFADNLHKLTQHRDTADRVAGTVLRLVHDRLRVRDETVRRETGTVDVPVQEVLRSLAEVVRQR